MPDLEWVDVGAAADFAVRPVTEITLGKIPLAISHRAGRFGAISGVCNHAAGPLGQGCLDGDFIVCPWHNWKFHRLTGIGEPGSEDDQVPGYRTKVKEGRLLVSAKPTTPRHKSTHPQHPLARIVKRKPGPMRVVGISTTGQDPKHPRYSTLEALLAVALEHARETLGCQTRLIKLSNLKFRTCEGYYSKSAQACTWPCSITQMDEEDELTEVYEALVHWADVVLVATPIRWGQASSLYFKMAERLNCVQNQITLKGRVLIVNKVASFIITGGQDNIQAVAGQLMSFFTELGFALPQFPFIAHSRGWTAEDMEQNVAEVQHSEELRKGARGVVERAVETANLLRRRETKSDKLTRGGRKAQRLDVERGR